jgi:hypothetical protein
MNVFVEYLDQAREIQTPEKLSLSGYRKKDSTDIFNAQKSRNAKSPSI